jgi:hypothetical protein
MSVRRVFRDNRTGGYRNPLLRNNGTSDHNESTLGHCCATVVWDHITEKFTLGATMTCDHISARMTKDATMTLGHMSATTTYVMWQEEHVWNVSVLHRVHLSNPVGAVTMETVPWHVDILTDTLCCGSRVRIVLHVCSWTVEIPMSQARALCVGSNNGRGIHNHPSWIQLLRGIG